MGISFSLNKLFSVWSEATERDEPTITFEISVGRGRFLFLMFFDPEDLKTKDQLLIFLQNTKHMLPLKLYGAHSKGVFQVYLNPHQIEVIRQELQLSGGTNPFDISQFMETLNACIPHSVPLTQKIKLLRLNLPQISPHLNDILDFAAKTELIGERSLPAGKKPREKTLRKLYLYSSDAPTVVANYIEDLKSRKCTLAWRIPQST